MWCGTAGIGGRRQLCLSSMTCEWVGWSGLPKWCGTAGIGGRRRLCWSNMTCEWVGWSGLPKWCVLQGTVGGDCCTGATWSASEWSVLDSLSGVYCRDRWEETAVLEQHDLRVSGLDWAPKSNRIVTCSADRNAYVWVQGKTLGFLFNVPNKYLFLWFVLDVDLVWFVFFLTRIRILCLILPCLRYSRL